MENDSLIVRSFYEGLNRNDISKVLSLCSQDIVREEWPGSPTASTHRGLQEFEDHLHKGRSTWVEGSCTPEELKSSKDKVLVYVHVHVRVKDKADWIDGYVADVFRIKNGKIAEFRSYMDKQQAIDWIELAFP